MEGDSRAHGMCRMEWLCLAAAVVVSLVVHAGMMIDGLGEQDAARLAVDASLWHQGGSYVYFDGDYKPKVSPLYLHMLKSYLDCGGSVASLPAAMNWTNVVLASVLIVPAYLLWRLLAGAVAAVLATIIWSFAPVFWLSGLYGMPHLPSLMMLVLAGLAFAYHLRLAGWRRWALYACTAVALTLSCMLKADVILCSLGLVGIAIVMRRLTWGVMARWAALPLLAAGATVGYSGILAPSAPRAGEFLSQWQQQYPFSVNAVMNSQVLVLVKVLGPVSFGAAIASGLWLLWRRQERRLVMLAAMWSLPSILFWSLKDGNCARHMLSPYFMVPLMIGTAFVLLAKTLAARRGRGVAWLFGHPGATMAVLSVALVVGNYFSIPPTRDLAQPSTRLVESRELLQDRLLYLASRGRQFAQMSDERKVLVGASTNPYILWEQLQVCSDFHWAGQSQVPVLELMTPFGAQQVRVVEVQQPCTYCVPAGWRPWWMENGIEVKQEERSGR